MKPTSEQIAAFEAGASKINAKMIARLLTKKQPTVEQPKTARK